MSSDSHRLHFTKSMEINGISPLPHYYEEIYTNLVGIEELGMRGDKNYLFYSVNGLGAGYYEKTEMELSAVSVYEHFKSSANRKMFFRGIEKTLMDLQKMTKKIDNIDLSSLSDQEVANYFLTTNQMHGRVFSYYIVSQPYRMKVFEEKLKYELSKRVAGSRVDSYIAELATSEKPTMVTHEEIAWLNFLMKYKERYGNKLDVDRLEQDFPDVYGDLTKHFNQYKSLTLGDGNWTYDIGQYVQNLKNDYHRDLTELKNTYQDRKAYPQKVKKRRDQLIKELYLDKDVVRDLAFLAEVGHTRLRMRIEGWLPFVATIIKLDIELSTRLGFHKESGMVLNFMSEQELKELTKGNQIVSEQEVVARMGSDSEFLILNDHGKYKILFGGEAGEKFRELVPAIDHTKVTELTGNTAVLGTITDKVCVYIWGDDLQEKLEIIKKYPILVTGQTRPSMMPIIRLAKGIVTDEGGVTSHAAIVSRELGIPSVIGTVHATRVFHDGDIAELDADNGVVRKLT